MLSDSNIDDAEISRLKVWSRLFAVPSVVLAKRLVLKAPEWDAIAKQILLLRLIGREARRERRRGMYALEEINERSMNRKITTIAVTQ
jgi:hypothetical protein